MDLRRPRLPPPDAPADRGSGRCQRPGSRRIPFLVLACSRCGRSGCPTSSWRPGPAQEVEPLIHVSGHPTYQSAGPPAAHRRRLLPAERLRGRRRRGEPARPRRAPRTSCCRPARARQQFIRQGFSQMDTSKIDATIVALTKEVGYPKNHGPGRADRERAARRAGDGQAVRRRPRHAGERRRRSTDVAQVSDGDQGAPATAGPSPSRSRPADGCGRVRSRPGT